MVQRVLNRPDLRYASRLVQAPAAHSMQPVTTLKTPGKILGRAAPAPAPDLERTAPVRIVGPVTMAQARPLQVDEIGADTQSIPVSLAANQSLEIAPSNAKRRYLLIQNNSGGILYLAIGRSAGLSDLQIVNGGYFEPMRAPRGSINLFSQVGGNAVMLQD